MVLVETFTFPSITAYSADGSVAGIDSPADDAAEKVRTRTSPTFMVPRLERRVSPPIGGGATVESPQATMSKAAPNTPYSDFTRDSRLSAAAAEQRGSL